MITYVNLIFFFFFLIIVLLVIILIMVIEIKKNKIPTILINPTPQGGHEIITKMPPGKFKGQKFKAYIPSKDEKRILEGLEEPSD